MSIMSDTIMIQAAQESQASKIEVEFAKCECCGLIEECTPSYISRVRERYSGKWICGLCSEAVKDEIMKKTRIISAEEALAKHMSFCKTFNSSPPPIDSTMHLISAMRHILSKSLESPKGLRSTPSSPKKNAEIRGPVLSRSESCFTSLSG